LIGLGGGHPDGPDFSPVFLEPEIIKVQAQPSAQDSLYAASWHTGEYILARLDLTPLWEAKMQYESSVQLRSSLLFSANISLVPSHHYTPVDSSTIVYTLTTNNPTHTALLTLSFSRTPAVVAPEEPFAISLDEFLAPIASETPSHAWIVLGGGGNLQQLSLTQFDLMQDTSLKLHTLIAGKN